jgi:uncharacterized protein YhaN
MTGEERNITGAADAHELRTMRDTLSELADAMRAQAAASNQLAGRFKEHADAEEHWQDRVEDWMREEPQRIAEGATEVVSICKRDAEPEVRQAVDYYRKQEAEDREELAVRSWLTDRVKRTVVLIVFAALMLATVLLMTNRNNAAAEVTAILGVATPFALLLFRR